MFEIWINSLCWAASAAGVAWYCGTTAQHLTYTTLADGRRQARPLPMLFRLLMPVARLIAPLIAIPAFTRFRESTRRRLISAGYDDVLRAEDLLALRMALPLVLGPIWCLMMALLIDMAPGRVSLALHRYQWIFFLLGVMLLFVYPAAWLKEAIGKRHRSIQRSLPFVLDLLTLSVEAGMDFMSALQRAVEKGEVSALGEELMRVVRQIQLGKTRREALRDMIARVNQSDMTSVMSSIVQADELGVSIGSILRIQSEQVRRKRFEQAEKRANEAPVKLLMPLICFIFPAVFIILLAPVVMQLAHILR